MIKQRLQIGIILLVVDDKTSVDRCLPLIRWRINCIRMAADPVMFFVYGNPVGVIEKPRRRHPGNSGPNYRYVQTTFRSGDDGIQFILFRITV